MLSFTTWLRTIVGAIRKRWKPGSRRVGKGLGRRRPMMDKNLLSHTAVNVTDRRTLLLEDGERPYIINAVLNDLPLPGNFEATVNARSSAEAAKKMIKLGYLDTLPGNLVADHITITISRRGN